MSEIILSSLPQVPDLSAREKTFPVVEIFGPTIEGEGHVIGTQTMFIRFGLCDYKCARCDSWHAVDPKLVKAGAQRLTAKQIMEALLLITPQHIRTVTFSGGNPAIHNLNELVDLLHIEGFFIVVETQGTKIPHWLTRVDHVVISPKGPGMGETFEPDKLKEVITQLRRVSNKLFSIKVVVFNSDDLDFATMIAGFMYAAAPDLEWQDNFYLSLGNPYPPEFYLEDSSVQYKSESKKELVLKLLSLYNILSEEIMQREHLHFAKFLPQLHVLVYGNETEK